MLVEGPYFIVPPHLSQTFEPPYGCNVCVYSGGYDPVVPVGDTSEVRYICNDRTGENL